MNSPANQKDRRAEQRRADAILKPKAAGNNGKQHEIAAKEHAALAQAFVDTFLQVMSGTPPLSRDAILTGFAEMERLGEYCAGVMRRLVARKD